DIGLPSSQLPLMKHCSRGGCHSGLRCDGSLLANTSAMRRFSRFSTSGVLIFHFLRSRIFAIITFRLSSMNRSFGLDIRWSNIPRPEHFPASSVPEDAALAPAITLPFLGPLRERRA